jgi:tripartite-type tricarboxylate transporter receptor subunit TctC
LMAVTLITAGTALPSHADEWPSKPIRWVVPFPPGGAMDAIARALGEKASKSLGQPFVIENKPGAGGNIGADQVAKSPGDGYTIMITSIGMATNKALYPKLSYDPVKDFAPVSLLAIVPNVLVTNTTQPTVKTVADVIANAKAQPGKLTYASAGNGTSIHLAGEVFASQAKVDMLHIPYKGSGSRYRFAGRTGELHV